jgi:hypothetical protein
MDCYSKAFPSGSPPKSAANLQEKLNRWAGFVCGRHLAPVSAKVVRDMSESGAVGISLSIFTHANTLSTVGTYRRFVESGNPAGWVAPLPWDAARKIGTTI